MEKIPSNFRTAVETRLRHKGVTHNTQAAYRKWLCYYWDFCRKYHFPPEQQTSLPHFLKKLQDKRQTESQREQAAEAIGMYDEVVEGIEPPVLTPNPSQEGNMTDAAQEGNEHASAPTSTILRIGSEQGSGQAPQGGIHPPGPPQGGNLSTSHPARMGRGASWQAEYTRLAEMLQGRQYDPKVAREFVWQWFFPAIELTYLEQIREYRRYHLHESHVRKALKQAVEEECHQKRGQKPAWFVTCLHDRLNPDWPSNR